MDYRLQELLSIYKKSLKFENFYDLVKENSCLRSGEYFSSDNILSGYTANPQLKAKSAISIKGAHDRVDVPIWFNDFKSSKKIIVYGSEPRDTNNDFNIEVIDNTVFGAPFGCDRWSVNSSVERTPHLKYYYPFKQLIDNNQLFVLFSDINKTYTVLSGDKKANDKIARNNFRKSIDCEQTLNLIKHELTTICPDIVLLLGNEVDWIFTRIVKLLSIDLTCKKVRHPSYGGQKIAQEQIKCVLSTL